VNDTPPPSQEQAAEAQQARYAAENSFFDLFASIETGSGGGEGEDNFSVLHSIKIALILSVLAAAIVYASFRSPRDKTKILISDAPDSDEISEQVLPDVEKLFKELSSSELTDKQRSVILATWAYSRTANEIADAIAAVESQNQFTKKSSDLKKIWISRSDNRVRPLHAKLHGKTVPVSDDFWRWPHTGERLRWPGDREAPGDTTIGCRCVCLLSWASQSDVSSTIRKIIEYTN